MPLGSRLQPRRLRQRGVRLHAHAQRHHARRPRTAVLDGRRHAAAVGRRERRHRRAQFDDDPRQPQLLGQQRAHFFVHRRQQLPAHFQQRHRQPAVPEALGQFHAHEPAADHDDALCARVELLGDAVHVLQRPQRQHFGQIDARQLELDRRRARRDDQLVVTLLALRPGLPVEDLDRLFRAVDGGHLVVHAHIHVEALAEILRCHHQQPAALGDDLAKVVRQPAVRVRNVRPLLQQHDFGFLVQPPQPRRRTRSARHAADDDGFHVEIPSSKSPANLTRTRPKCQSGSAAGCGGPLDSRGGVV